MKTTENIFTTDAETYFRFSQNNASWLQTERPAIEKFLQEYIQVKKDPTKLHYFVAGCGWGREMKMLHDKGVPLQNISGIDLSMSLIQMGKVQYPKLNTVVGSIADIPIASNTQDVVISSMVIQYLDRSRLEQFIAESRRILKNDGNIFIHATHPFWLKTSDTYYDVEPVVTETPWGSAAPMYPHPLEDFTSIFKKNKLSFQLYSHKRPTCPEYEPMPEAERWSPHRISYVLTPYR